MRIHALFVTRTYETSTPELADAWDEYCIDGNPEGFDEAKKKAATDDEVQAFAEVVFEVDERAVMNALYPTLVVVPAEVPDEAMNHAREAFVRGRNGRSGVGAAVEAAAPLIVAAELERIAETLHTSCRIDDLIGTATAAARNGVRNELLARASELRGEG